MKLDLPSAGRFRPASRADFLKCAKNFSWLTALSLQTAQDVLSQLYGYAGTHELSRVLEKEGLAGPFSPPLAWPAFCDGAVPAGCLFERAEQEPPDRELLRARHLRTWALVDQLAGDAFPRKRLMACVDAGFFCRPSEHRETFRAVKEGCLALEGSSEERGEYLRAHWPVGFWALLERRYPALPPSEDGDHASNMDRLTRAQMLDSMRAYRAPMLFLEMLGDCSGVPRGRSDYDDWLDFVEGPAHDAAFVTFETDHDGWETTVEEWFRSYGNPQQQVQRATGKPMTKRVLSRALKAHSSPEALLADADFVKSAMPAELADDLLKVARTWRLSELVSRCSLTRERMPPRALLRSYGHMPGGPRYSQLYRELQECSKVPGLESAIRGNGIRHELAKCRASGLLATYVHLEQERSELGENIGMSLWRYKATFCCEPEDTSLFAAPAVSAAGEIMGWMSGFLLVPFDDEHRVHPATWFEALDAHSALLNDVWKTLQYEYFPSCGYADINDFVEENPYACICLASFELTSKWRGKGVVPFLMNNFTSTLRDSVGSHADAGWHLAARMLTDDDCGDFGRDDILDHEPPDSPLVGEPAVFVFPVEGSEPEHRRGSPLLRGSRGTVRKADPNDEKEKLKRKLTAHFLKMREMVDEDIVVYDPWEWPMT